jgi:hypothetical protein
VDLSRGFSFLNALVVHSAGAKDFVSTIRYSQLQICNGAMKRVCSVMS